MIIDLKKLNESGMVEYCNGSATVQFEFPVYGAKGCIVLTVPDTYKTLKIEVKVFD